MARYPDECSVFDVDGEHYEARPAVNAYDDILGWLIATADGEFYHIDPSKDKPLTRAARELLAWSRQK